MSVRKSPTPEQERKLTGIVAQLMHFNLDWIGQGLLSLLKVSKRDEPIQTPQEKQVQSEPGPIGPFLTRRKRQRGDLLLFVPRRLESWIIDHVTGRYGYSHLAVDCGEDDVTGKAVMIESTVGRLVDRVFLDSYGARHFARVPLSHLGMDVERFCACVTEKLGQPYDNLEALTWGKVDDPAKQVCSDLASVCLPEPVREDIARASRLGLLRRRAVSVHSRRSMPGAGLFISPNGFAEYFGAPQGEDLTQADQLVTRPRPITRSPGRIALRLSWKIGAVAVALMIILGSFFVRLRRAKK
jgi:hypothetical protein